MSVEITSLLKSLAPTVASAFLGPAGGAVVAAIGGILGQESPTVASITDAIQKGQLSADQISQIKQLELKYQDDEKERGFRYVELQYKDVDSARKMQMATNSSTPTILSYCVLGVGGWMMVSVLYGWAKVDTVLAGTLIGYAVAEMKSVLQYWFGSSQGSKDKDAAMMVTKSGE